MYINYMSDWIVKILQIRIPLVLSQEVVYLVTIWDLFMLTVFLGIFIILIKYIITDSIDIKLGDTDINYSSTSYIPNKVHKVSSKIKKHFKKNQNVGKNISDIQSKKDSIIQGVKK